MVWDTPKMCLTEFDYAYGHVSIPATQEQISEFWEGIRNEPPFPDYTIEGVKNV